MNPGKLVVIEGMDASGKETQPKLLISALGGMGIKTAYFDFPQHGEGSAGSVDNYLNGDYGTASEVDPRIASVLYAVDRYVPLSESGAPFQKGGSWFAIGMYLPIWGTRGQNQR